MKRLTEAQCDLALEQTRKHAKTKRMVKSVLVDGESPTVVARRNHVRRQQVSDAADLVYAIYLKTALIPSDWVKCEGFFPPEEAQILNERAAALLEEHHKKKE